MLYVLNFNALSFENEAAYIEFVEKTINAQLSDHLNDLQLFQLVKIYQVDANSRTCWRCNKNECRVSYGRYFTEKTIIAQPLDFRFSNDEKQQVATWGYTLLRQVKALFITILILQK